MKINRTLLIGTAFVVSIMLFCSIVIYLAMQPEPQVIWTYEGAYENSLLFQNGEAWMAYDVYTHETVSANSYRGIIDMVKNK